ncbi:MAG: flavodoxin domain-containing protein [Burkholderiaceae bacterium]|nr:flavodoxin domain-containing protein [Burkholderiaceae bacterium]
MRINILVATMTGTAQLVAQELELTFGDDDTEIVVTPMDNLGPEVFTGEETYLICTSTYGQGDVPDNGKPLYDALRAQRPDLSAVRYGVIGLGDNTYKDTFNFGGQKFDDLLSELGAKRIGERARLDAAGGQMPEDLALEWMPGWLELARAT